MIDKRIGFRLKQCRERKGITQEQLAELVGLSPGYISSIERSEKFPRIDKLIQILNTLEISADSIFIDLLDCADVLKASQFEKRLSGISARDRKRILLVLETMLTDAESDN